ncbi:hypothetical protein [Prochlorococcus sp. MIT 1306]|uniref:hypothetical protein n=1 Tax=Prochlorococcus sp. MIT 1306 TaxID=1799667 RepID=UPI0007B36C3B|nr:hypothetical protein [Prochlorococcus sp. MIT 1306]KZR65044.1 hypothetical protein PMIT1306_00725 [Prochlorococcus sp. MIT 1306]
MDPRKEKYRKIFKGVQDEMSLLLLKETKKLEPLDVSIKASSSRASAINKLRIDMCEPLQLQQHKKKLLCVELAGSRSGREIIEALIAEESNNQSRLLFVEFGSFMGASSKRWSQVVDHIDVITVDPWIDDLSEYLSEIRVCPIRNSMVKGFSHDEYSQMIEDLKAMGIFYYVKTLLNDYKNILPIRGRSPYLLFQLHLRGIYPDIIYYDANKSGVDLRIALELFPFSILCGDDFMWKDENGQIPLQAALEEIQQIYGGKVDFLGQSWILRR